VCRLGEALAPPSDMNCFDWWLRVTRRMRLDGTESLRGPGEDIESSSIVAMMSCRRSLARPRVGTHAVSQWRSSESRAGYKLSRDRARKTCMVAKKRIRDAERYYQGWSLTSMGSASVEDVAGAGAGP